MMKEETEYEFGNIVVMRKYVDERKKFVCSVDGNEQYITGSVLLAKAWYYEALRSWRMR